MGSKSISKECFWDGKAKKQKKRQRKQKKAKETEKKQREPQIIKKNLGNGI